MINVDFSAKPRAYVIGESINRPLNHFAVTIHQCGHHLKSCREKKASSEFPRGILVCNTVCSLVIMCFFYFSKITIDPEKNCAVIEHELQSKILMTERQL